eukprot:SAG22_NODE_76_length_22248_cov_14.352070_4_plen_39_part_00
MCMLVFTITKPMKTSTAVATDLKLGWSNQSGSSGEDRR